MPFATTWIDGEGISEISQRKRQIPYGFSYMLNLKNTKQK